jgi:hypothetical protein
METKYHLLRSLALQCLAVGAGLALVWLLATLLNPSHLLTLIALVLIVIELGVLFLGVIVGWKGFIYALALSGLAMFTFYAFGACLGVDFMTHIGFSPELASHPYKALVYPINGFILLDVIGAFCGAYFYVDSYLTAKTRIMAFLKLTFSASCVVVGFAAIASLSFLL